MAAVSPSDVAAINATKVAFSAILDAIKPKSGVLRQGNCDLADEAEALREVMRTLVSEFSHGI